MKMPYLVHQTAASKRLIGGLVLLSLRLPENELLHLNDITGLAHLRSRGG